MRCPFCAHIEDKVIDTRSIQEGLSIRRRRECMACGRRFTSYERIEQIPYMVKKKDGRREEFSREKLLGGLRKACGKRPIAIAELESIAGEAERLVTENPDRELSTAELGEFLMERLYEIDEIAYIRYASVYRQFKDIRHFMRELRDLIGIELPDVRQLQRGMDRPPRQRGTGERQRTLDLESGEEPPKKDRSG